MISKSLQASMQRLFIFSFYFSFASSFTVNRLFHVNNLRDALITNLSISCCGCPSPYLSSFLSSQLEKGDSSHAYVRGWEISLDPFFCSHNVKSCRTTNRKFCKHSEGREFPVAFPNGERKQYNTAKSPHLVTYHYHYYCHH